MYYRVCRARALCMSVHSAYYLRAAGMMGGEMIVVVKYSGEEEGKMLLRRTCRLRAKIKVVVKFTMIMHESKS